MMKCRIGPNRDFLIVSLLPLPKEVITVFIGLSVSTITREEIVNEFQYEIFLSDGVSYWQQSVRFWC